MDNFNLDPLKGQQDPQNQQNPQDPQYSPAPSQNIPPVNPQYSYQQPGQPQYGAPQTPPQFNPQAPNQYPPQRPYNQEYSSCQPPFLTPEQQSRRSAATVSLVLGIISLVFSFICCCFAVPFIAIIPAIISLVFAAKANKGPEKYSGASAGRILSIIGIVAAVLLTALLILCIVYSNDEFVNEFNQYYSWYKYYNG